MNPSHNDLDGLSPAELSARLADALAQPLPGRAAHRRVRVGLSYGRHQGPPPPACRLAAVLVLLYPDHGRWHVPLTLRPPHLSTHGGQVSFPGGARERGETAEQTALRKAHEELGIDERRVQLLGRLSPLYVFASNFHVVPSVGLLDERPAWTAEPREVAQVLECPVGDLLAANPWPSFLVQRGSLRFAAPYWPCQGHRVWGASCLILAELAEVLRGVVDVARWSPGA